QRHNLPLWKPILTSFLAYSLALTERVDEATALLNEARDQAAAMRLGVFSTQMILWFAEAHLLGGGVSEAAALGHEALENAREPGERGYEAWALWLGAEIAARPGELDAVRAEALYREAHVAAEARGMRPLVARARLGLGRLHGRLGRRVEARKEIED